ncbi:MAG: prepilin-type N-terminal cleavage/methylation domain-containing protein [Candidatus Eisenbacteria bacterium]
MRATRKNQTDRGYTLIEALLVVIILGLAGGLAVSWLGSSLEDGAIRAATDGIVTALEYGRLYAINSGLPSRVSFDGATMTVTVERLVSAGGDDLRDTSIVSIGSTKADDWEFAPAGHPFARGLDYVIELSEDRSVGGGGVDRIEADFGGVEWVEFDEIGSASASGAATIERGNRRVRIAVDSLTGRVSVHE